MRSKILRRDSIPGTVLGRLLGSRGGVGQGDDSIVDMAAWTTQLVQKVPESKVIKNRIHFDIGVSGGRTNDI
jgi:hypothetical protein